MAGLRLSSPLISVPMHRSLFCLSFYTSFFPSSFSHHSLTSQQYVTTSSHLWIFRLQLCRAFFVSLYTSFLFKALYIMIIIVFHGACPFSPTMLHSICVPIASYCTASCTNKVQVLCIVNARQSWISNFRSKKIVLFCGDIIRR